MTAYLKGSVEDRLTLLEAKGLGIDQSDVRAIARDCLASELGNIATELETLRALSAAQAQEIEVLRKLRPPDTLTMVMGAIDPLMDELVGLERRVEPIAVVAEVAQAAKSAAASAVKNSELALLGGARDFVFGE